MYNVFFGLQHAPFSIAPDPRYLFMSQRHREALAHLLYAVEGGGGFVLVSGEIGAGKTTVCRCFLEQVPGHCNVAYIFNPKLTVIELLQTILQELHIGPAQASTAGGLTVKDCVDPLNTYLLAQHAAGRSTVLVIDEAQNLSSEVLEQLRLLTNLETYEKKLLQIILIGQPELRALLAQPELEQLAQRVIARFHLDALAPQETRAYVRHRLGVAGHSGPLPFDDAALARVHALSRGVPRRINLLCDRALLGAYAKGQARVSRAVIERAAQEVFDNTSSSARVASAGSPRALSGASWGAQWFSPGKVAACLTALAVGGGLWWSATQRSPAPQVAEPKAASPGAQSAAPSPAQVATSAESVANAVVLPQAAASTAAVRASAASTTPPALASSDSELQALLAQLPSSAQQAWMENLSTWGWALPSDNPCTGSANAAWRCFQTQNANLAMLRQLDRPGLLTLYDAAGVQRQALLAQMDEQSVTLRLGQQSLRMPHTSLAQWWRGQFSAPWRVPEPLQGLPAADGRLPPPASRQSLALARVLEQHAPAAAPGDTAERSAQSPLPQQVRSFQLAQGLTPDGLVGALTLMQVARVALPQEPRLGLAAKP